MLRAFKRAESPAIKRLFLLAAPNLQLTLTRNGFKERPEFLGMCELNGPPYRSVTWAQSSLVPIYARSEVGRVAHLQRGIRAAKDVDVRNMVPLDSLRSLGTPLD